MSSMSDQKQSHFEEMIIQTTLPQKRGIRLRNGDSVNYYWIGEYVETIRIHSA
jgi:hypothetical protein